MEKSWKSENDLVRTDVVAVEELASYLEKSNGRERHEYLPYQWNRYQRDSESKDYNHPFVKASYQVTHYLVLSWKCRG